MFGWLQQQNQQTDQVELEEKFTAKHCGKDIKIQGNYIEYIPGGWNAAYGNVTIDAKKYPNGTYKWVVQPQNLNETINIGIGISSNRVNKACYVWTQNENGVYGYDFNGWITEPGKSFKCDTTFKNNDKITMEIDITQKTVTFLKNGTLVHTIKNMDISKKYWFATSLSNCGARLVSYTFHPGEVTEEKQDNQFKINSAELVEDLQNQLLNNLKEIDELKKINKKEREQSQVNAITIQELQNKSVSLEQKVSDLQKRLETIMYEKELVQNEVNETKKLNDFLLKQQEEEKKDESVDGLKNELISLTDKMDEFNTKYDKNMLSTMYNDDPDSLFVEEEINNTELSCKSLEKHLQDIKNYVVSTTKPDITQYKKWDISTAIIWIKSLDNGYFIQYCDVLRKGFESDGIPASELPNVGASDLATTPFNIRSFMDRKKLAQHFKSLQSNQIANEDEGGQTIYIG